MNKINHKPAQDIICDIIQHIKKQIETALKFKGQKISYETDTRLAEEFRNSKIAEINAAYLAELRETRAFIAEKLERVGELEEENENILDFDIPEFSETMMVIDATKENIPETVVRGIINKFKGNYQVMASIKAVLEGFGVDLKTCNFNLYAEPARDSIARMIVNAENIETSADTSFISLENLLKEVVSFGKCRGMVFSDEFIKLDTDAAAGLAKVKDAVQTQMAREAMGL